MQTLQNVSPHSNFTYQLFLKQIKHFSLSSLNLWITASWKASGIRCKQPRIGQNSSWLLLQRVGSAQFASSCTSSKLCGRTRSRRRPHWLRRLHISLHKLQLHCFAAFEKLWKSFWVARFALRLKWFAYRLQWRELCSFEDSWLECHRIYIRHRLLCKATQRCIFCGNCDYSSTGSVCHFYFSSFDIKCKFVIQIKMDFGVCFWYLFV